MKKSTSTTVMEKLIDLELIFQLKADLSRYKKRKTGQLNKGQASKAA